MHPSFGDDLLGILHQVRELLNIILFYFQKIEEPFLLAVKETLGDRYSANMEHIYRKTIKFILDTLIEGFNK